MDNCNNQNSFDLGRCLLTNLINNVNTDFMEIDNMEPERESSMYLLEAGFKVVVKQF